MHRPDLLFLDEPTTGLDPQARRRVWEIVEAFKGEGGTVVLTAPDEAAVRAVLGIGALVVCRGVTAAEAAGVAPRGGASAPQEGLRVDGYAQAAAAAAQGKAAVLVVRAGRTREADVSTVCTLLQEVGVEVAGTLVVCGSGREAAEVWG